VTGPDPAGPDPAGPGAAGPGAAGGAEQSPDRQELVEPMGREPMDPQQAVGQFRGGDSAAREAQARDPAPHPVPFELVRLGRRVAELEGLVRALGRSGETLRGEVIEMLTDYGITLDDLRARLGARPPGDPEQPPEPWWQRATTTDRAELAEWVDAMLPAYNPLTRLWLPPCWLHPDHRGIAEELAAAYTAWCKAARADTAARADGSHSEALAAWHERWWWPMLARLSTQRFEACTKGTGHKPAETPPATDRTYLTHPHGRPPMADRYADALTPSPNSTPPAPPTPHPLPASGEPQ
jgi:hypothetical protein